MITNDSQRTRLAQLVTSLAVVRGRVTLASGVESDFYVDMRRATLHHEAAPLIGHVMIDMLEEAGYSTEEIDAVGGLTMGADPVATAIPGQRRGQRSPGRAEGQRPPADRARQLHHR